MVNSQGSMGTVAVFAAISQRVVVRTFGFLVLDVVSGLEYGLRDEFFGCFSIVESGFENLGFLIPFRFFHARDA